MEWHLTDAQSLAIIDREIGSHQFSPAEYEIVRRVIYGTGDFSYSSSLSFSTGSLHEGAIALAAQTPIIVDVPAIQVNIVPLLRKTFLNPVYCCTTIVSQGAKQTSITKAVTGLQILAKRFPASIFIIGEQQTALTTLVTLLENELIQPALVISTPTVFTSTDAQTKLLEFLIPYICTKERKGSPTVATAIFRSLVELSWQVYGGGLNNLEI